MNISADKYKREQKEDVHARAQEILLERRRRAKWMEDNFHEEWVQVFQNYKCEEDPRLDPNDEDKIDLEASAVGMPDTWGMTRRFVARVTAQPPSHRFLGTSPDVADRITRGQMLQWDKAKIQRLQKKDVLQAGLFGISVLAWSWENEEFTRRRRVNPNDPQWWNEIAEQYAEELDNLAQENGTSLEQVLMLQEGDPQLMLFRTLAAERLLAEHGKADLIPIEYSYKCYEGPKADLMFVGDCYFEPNFEHIQKQTSFIVDRRRDEAYLDRLMEVYGFTEGVELLKRTFPEGSTHQRPSSNLSSLKEKLQAVTERTTDDFEVDGRPSRQWTITEKHVGGKKPYVDLVAEDGIWIGRIENPYFLDGKIPFTQLVFVDDLLSGIGDSTARVTRGLVKLHNRLANARADLVHKLLYTLVGTNDYALFENPEAIKRIGTMRLFYTSGGQGSLWTHNDGAAISSAMASLNDESSMQRMLQVASGESNLSLAADVDPQQNRTATGAKIQARAADVLTKDAIDMYTFALVDQLEMMYLLNRSELTEPIAVDTKRYPSTMFPDGPQDPDAAEQLFATPEDFQHDGEIQVEVGSTLADDDDTKLSRAQFLMQLATSFPNLFNAQAAATDLLKALGKGKNLKDYLAQPAPPQPERPKASLSVQVDKYPPEIQAALLSDHYGVDKAIVEAWQKSQPTPAQPQSPMQPPAPAGQGQMPQLPAPGATPAQISPNGLDPMQQNQPI